MTTRVLTAIFAAILAAGVVPAAAYADGPDHRGAAWGHGPRHKGGPHGRWYRHHACRYVPGHYENRTVEVFVPGFWRDEHVPPVYREFCGRYGMVRVMVAPATVERIWVPGRTVYNTQQFWVPGYWACGCR